MCVRTYLGFFFIKQVSGMQLRSILPSHGRPMAETGCQHVPDKFVDSWKPASGQQVFGLLNRVVYTGCQAHRPCQQVPCIALVNCCCTQPSSFRETKPLHATTFYPDHSLAYAVQYRRLCVLEQKDCMSQCMVFAPNEEPCQFYAKTVF